MARVINNALYESLAAQQDEAGRGPELPDLLLHLLPPREYQGQPPFPPTLRTPQELSQP